ncbi:preprotein translocase subunit SecG [Pelagibius sp. CAU 1746]|uniref:preprotein translocase subunit SecG n=1 Tax=Pelagibius sp. CAU 1746 TaxID=3140370 RepID=UPI00325B4702
MVEVLLVVHILLALALIGVVLLQRSEGGGLGIGGGGGGGGGMGGFLTGRGTANLLTRTTAILAAGFMATSVLLTILAGADKPTSILDTLPGQTGPSGTAAPAVPAPAGPSEPTVPTQ